MKSKINTSYIILFLLIILTSCQSERSKKIAEISSVEKTLFTTSGPTPDIALAEKLTGLYAEFAKTFPEDSLASEYLFKAAEVTNGIGKPEQAYEMFGALYTKYPESEKAPFSLFMQGFVAETKMFNKDKAKQAYILFLQKYPSHAMAKDVQFSLDNIDKSDEELIRQFEEMNAENEDPS